MQAIATRVNEHWRIEKIGWAAKSELRTGGQCTTPAFQWPHNNGTKNTFQCSFPNFQLRKFEAELRTRESREGTEVLMSALQAMQDKNSTLEKNLSAETRVKLDLFSALGEAKRQLEIRESAYTKINHRLLPPSSSTLSEFSRLYFRCNSAERQRGARAESENCSIVCCHAVGTERFIHGTMLDSRQFHFTFERRIASGASIANVARTHELGWFTADESVAESVSVYLNSFVHIATKHN